MDCCVCLVECCIVKDHLPIGQEIQVRTHKYNRFIVIPACSVQVPKPGIGGNARILNISYVLVVSPGSRSVKAGSNPHELA